MLRKIIIFFILSSILFSSFSTHAFELDQSNATVEGYYLYDMNHNILMANENADILISPSSTAKIMSACIILESGIDLKQEITVTKNMLNGVSGRNMLLKPGDVLSGEDLLYAVLCGGYNDATHVLAIATYKSIYKFTEKMNEKAVELRMTNTHYLNPTGIDAEEMVTTINDVALLAKYMSKNETFVSICSTKYYKLSDNSVCDFKTISNRSSLLSEYKGLANFSTGSGDNGDSAVLFYENEDLSLISIVMNAKSKNSNNNTNYSEVYSKKLFSHAYNNYSYKTVKTKNEIITSLPVKYSISSENINVYLQNDLKIFTSESLDIEKELSFSIYIKNGELCAPLNNDDIVGTITVFADGILLGSAPLIIKENIERNTFLYFMEIFKQFILSRVLLISMIAFLFMIVIYFIRKKRKFRKRKHK